MNKKIVISSLFALMLTFFAGDAYAQSIGVGASTKTASVLFLPFTVTPVMDLSHDPISRVSQNIRKFLAIGSISVQNINGLKADNVYMEYYFDSPATISTLTATTLNKVSASTYTFELDLEKSNIPASPTYNTMYYRIVVVSTEHGGSVDYYPSSTTYQTVAISSQTSGLIGNAGGKVILESGNQKEGSSSIEFANTALISSYNFIITELESSQVDPHVSTDMAKPVISYDFKSSPPSTGFETFVNSSPSQLPIITMYYGDKVLAKDKTKIEVMWYDSVNDDWIPVPFTNNVNNTVTVNLALTQTGQGYYAIFIDNVGSAFNSNNYRPEFRMIRPGATMIFGERVGSKAPSIKSVEIYNLKGARVATLTDASGFAWQGRSGTDNNGGLVESGSYIYQIKINGQKTVSGSIVFVR